MPSVEYYMSSDGHDHFMYYEDGSEAEGEWWVPDEGSVAFNLHNERKVEEADFRSLCDGVLPSGKTVQNSIVRRLGYDITLSMPKPVSILAMLGDERLRKSILSLHDRAVRRTLKLVHSRGLLDARRGKAGWDKEAPASFVAAIFRHHTSRLNDPQVHSHCVVPNICVRHDGTVGTFDNNTLVKYAGFAGAMYRAELATGLRALGFEIDADRGAFAIAGMPLELCKLFSKRRNEIEARAEELGVDLSVDREAAQRIALETRSKKASPTSLSELRDTWLDEMSSAGFTLSDIPTAGETHLGMDDTELANAFRDAIQNTFERTSTISHPHLLREIAEALQCTASADQIEAVLSSNLVAETVDLDPHERRDIFKAFSTARIIEAERQLVSLALQGKNAKSLVPTEAVESALGARPTLSDEQCDAVRHALAGGTIKVVEGSAGSGKSFMLAAVFEALSELGTVYAVGTSWVAANVLAGDVGAPEDRTFALTTFLNAVERDKVVLRPGDAIILDEAGMAGTLDMARLAQIVSSAGAKLVLSGDTKQLSPVSAGSPMRLLVRAIGNARMNQIRRQKQAWCRAASMLFAAGRAEDALRAYDNHGNIEWLEGREQTIEALADRYVADMLFDRLAGVEKTSLAIAVQNNEVLELNAAIRSRLQMAKFLSQTEVEVPIARIKDPKSGKKVSSTLRVSQGDRLVFKETVKLGKRNIRNADIATVISVEAFPDPVLEMRFERDGEIVRARASELVGFRNDGEPKAPMITHPYAGTVNFSQGMTIDRMYAAGLNAMSKEAIYVAMTRHRDVAQLFVETTRFEERARQVEIRDARDANIPRFSWRKPARLETRKQLFYAQCERENLKQNVADRVSDLQSWARSSHAIDGPNPGVGSSPGNQLDHVRLKSRLSMPSAASPSEASLGTSRDHRGLPSRIYRTLRSRWQAGHAAGMAFIEWLLAVRDDLLAQILSAPDLRRSAGRRFFLKRPVGLSPDEAVVADALPDSKSGVDFSPKGSFAE